MAERRDWTIFSRILLKASRRTITRKEHGVVCVCVISYLYPATCSLKGYGSGSEATAVGFFGIHILSQTGLACPSRAPLSPSPPPICGAGWDLFGASRGPRPFTDNPPHAKLPAVHNTDRILDSIILLIQISYLPVCAIHEFSLQ